MASRVIGVLVLFLLLSASSLFADDEPAIHKNVEFGFWSGGGRGVSGTTKDTELLIAGVRVGKILTATHGSGFFRGNLEYVLDAIPLFVVFQEQTTTGFDVTPVLMKWNFITQEGRPTMFFEIGGGTLFTSAKVPTGISQFNFTPQAGFGFFLSSNPKRAATLEFKYMHISDGGRHRPNPGINSVHILIGYHWLH